MAIFRLAVSYGLKKIKKVKGDKNRSYCDSCGRQLSWHENMPVISWLIQKGQTRCCGNPLPWQYPILEITMGIIFLVMSYQLRVVSWQLIIYLVIASTLVFSLLFDLKYMILPDMANLFLINLSLILLIGKADYLSYVLSGVGTVLFFFVLNRIKIRGGEAMGMGDVKYSPFIGLFLGWPNTLVAIYFAFVVGAVVSLVLLSLRIVKRETPIPFGPFLILGTVVAKVWGEMLINYFISVLF